MDTKKDTTEQEEGKDSGVVVDKVSEDVVDKQLPIEETQEPKYTEAEQRAREQGWRPKEEWTGDPDSFRSAREFLDRGELLSKIKSQSQELRNVTEMVQQLSEHNKRVYIAGYNNAINELRGARAKALEEGDGKSVAAIEERLDKAKDELAQLKQVPAYAQPQQPQGPSPELQQFAARNPWYRESATMRHWARGMAIEFARVNPEATETDVYRFLEKTVRKDFPQKFNTGGGPPSPDGPGRQSDSRAAPKGSTSFDKLMATLPEDQARAAKEMVKQKLLTKEKYVADYEAVIQGR